MSSKVLLMCMGAQKVLHYVTGKGVRSLCLRALLDVGESQSLTARAVSADCMGFPRLPGFYVGACPKCVVNVPISSGCHVLASKHLRSCLAELSAHPLEQSQGSVRTQLAYS